MRRILPLLPYDYGDSRIINLIHWVTGPRNMCKRRFYERSTTSGRFPGDVFPRWTEIEKNALFCWYPPTWKSAWKLIRTVAAIDRLQEKFAMEMFSCLLSNFRKKNSERYLPIWWASRHWSNLTLAQNATAQRYKIP